MSVNAEFVGDRVWVPVQVIGSGGQGEVFTVYEKGDAARRLFALKRLKSNIRETPERPKEIQRRRFSSEAAAHKALAELGCPGIAPVVDSDLQAAQPWFVVPYFAAGAMWQAKRVPPYLEPYAGNTHRVLGIVASLADTLAFMHGTSPGWVHRDVKCGNVFFSEPGGDPVLGDLGLVFTEDAVDLTTDVGDRLGPQLWRPPELRRGGTDKHHSGSDIYMLGGVLYEALSGGETLDDVEQPDGSFAHESPRFSVGRFVDSDIANHINRLLRGTFRRDPDARISASDVARLCRAIAAWKPGQDLPVGLTDTDEAELAAEQFRIRSRSIRQEAIRVELADICQRAIAPFGPSGWAPLNRVTKMIDLNHGDTAPIGFVAREYPDSVWIAVRVLVAFETAKARPMLMSYVFVGRTPDHREIVGLYDEEEKWTTLSEAVEGDPTHEELIRRTALSERDRLSRKIAPLIAALD